MSIGFDHVKLIDDVTGDELIIWPSADNNGAYHLVDLDLGFPEIRAVIDNRAGANGAEDFTSLYGSKVVAMTVKVTTDDALAALRGWLAPTKRPRLVYKRPGSVGRELTLRAAQFSAPMPRAIILAGIVETQLQWVCPEGLEYSEIATETYIARQVDPGAPGLDFTADFPVDFPGQVGSGNAIVVNGGRENSYPIIRIFGPVVGPRIVNETLGMTLEMLGYSLADGEYVEIDTRAKTMQLNGLGGPDYSVRSSLTTRQWWWLVPGNNEIRFTATTGAPPSQALIISKDAWL